MKNEARVCGFLTFLGAQNPFFTKKHDMVLRLGEAALSLPPLPPSPGDWEILSEASYQISQMLTRQVGLHETDERTSAILTNGEAEVRR